MAKQVKYFCDIRKCSNEAKYKDKLMQVIFLTEQTEGRTTKPYFEMSKIDLCDDCDTKILTNKRYIVASGAQGHNEYFIKND